LRWKKISKVECSLSVGFCVRITLVIFFIVNIYSIYSYLPSIYSMESIGSNMEWMFEDIGFKERKASIIDKGISLRFDEEIGLIKGSSRDQLYYVLSVFEGGTFNSTLLKRANMVLRNFMNKFIIYYKLAGFRKFGGVIRFLDDNYLSVDGDYDKNYVNFLSPFLIYVYLEHQDMLESDVRDGLGKVLPLIASTLFAIQNNVDYTNMYLLKCAGELMYARFLNSYPLLFQARADFLKWVRFILENGIPEYNSPNYGFVDWWALGTIISYSMDNEFYYIARAVAEWFIAEFCLHYHPKFDSIVGSSARAKASSYWWGLQSGSAPFYLYWNSSDLSRFSSSSTRLLTVPRYFPSSYLGEMAINKTYPLILQGYHYGISTQDYITEDYTLGTCSGAHDLSHLGSTASGLSGEQVELSIFHNGTYAINTSSNSTNIKYIRKTCWWDTYPHYQAFNSIQFEGTAISLVNLEITENKKDNKYYSVAYLGSKKGITEVRINNNLWDGQSTVLARNSDTIITINFNNTYLMIRPTNTNAAEIIDTKASQDYPIIFEYQNLTNEDGADGYEDYLEDELVLKTYLYKGNDKWMPLSSRLMTGYIIEMTSAAESGLNFSEFSSFAQLGIVNEQILGEYRTVDYQSAIRSGCELYLSENIYTHEIISRKINGVEFDDNWLLKSKYVSIPKNADINDVFKMLQNSTEFADLDSDGLADSWELTYWRKLDVANATNDPDSDGLNNLVEFQLGTDPSKATYAKDLENSLESIDLSDLDQISIKYPILIAGISIATLISSLIIRKYFDNFKEKLSAIKVATFPSISKLKDRRNKPKRKKRKIIMGKKSIHQLLFNSKYLIISKNIIPFILIAIGFIMDLFIPSKILVIFYYRLSNIILSVGCIILIEFNQDYFLKNRILKEIIYSIITLLCAFLIVSFFELWLYHYMLFFNMVLICLVLAFYSICIFCKIKNQKPIKISSKNQNQNQNQNQNLTEILYILLLLLLLFGFFISIGFGALYYLMTTKNEFEIIILQLLHIISASLWLTISIFFVKIEINRK